MSHWYVYIQDEGFEVYDTEEEARDAAYKGMDRAREQAKSDGEWPPDMDAFEWGRLDVRERAVEVDAIEAETGYEFSEYELLPTAEELFDFAAWCERHREWSEITFGPREVRGPAGPIQHLRKEIEELADSPDNLEEAVDIIHLAVDASQRAGHTIADLCEMLMMKQQKNFTRTWPDWRTQPKDSAIEHVRTEAPTTPETTAANAWSRVSAARAELAAWKDEALGEDWGSE